MWKFGNDHQNIYSICPKPAHVKFYTKLPIDLYGGGSLESPKFNMGWYGEVPEILALSFPNVRTYCQFINYEAVQSFNQTSQCKQKLRAKIMGDRDNPRRIIVYIHFSA